MPVLRQYGFGQITSVIKADGAPYTEGEMRLGYVGRPGLVLFSESSHKCPGQYFLYLYPYEDGMIQEYFHSSCGNLSYDRHHYTLKTGQSIYTVDESPTLLTGDEKMDVLLNTATLSLSEAQNCVAEYNQHKDSQSLYSIYIRRMTKELPDRLKVMILSPPDTIDSQEVSCEIDKDLSMGLISPDQARYLNNKYVNFDRTGRTYYV